MSNEKAITTDAQLLSFKVNTFISIIVAIVIMTFTVAGFYFTSTSFQTQFKTEKEVRKEADFHLDERITKTTTRNKEAIERLEDAEDKKLEEALIQLIEILKTKTTN